MTSTPTASAPSIGVSPLVHVKRALGWNLGRVAPSPGETAALVAAGVTDPTVQRYVAWRRSLMRFALVPTSIALVLTVLDAADNDYGELTVVAAGLWFAMLAAAAALWTACFLGARKWTTPGAGSGLLRTAYLAAFLIPFVYALLPAGLLVHVHDLPAHGDSALVDKIDALRQMAIEFVLSGSGYLMLLPAVLSLFPGAMNGCLRIKALLPAAQLPGWLLVCAAPAFLLFWLVLLTLANHAAQSPLLVVGILLWAGSPVWYALKSAVFVRSQISEEDASKIGRVKKLVGMTALAGILLMGVFITTKEVVGLKVLGFDRATAMSTQLQTLGGQDDEVSLEDVQSAYEHSHSVLYALDVSSWRMVVDTLAKLLLITAIFADLILRATLTGWRNDRALRASAGAGAFDASAAAADAALAPPR